MKKRILLVTSEFPPLPGGIGNHAYNLSRQLSLHHYDVGVIADQRSELGDEEANFDKNLDFNVHRIGLKKWRIPMYFKRLWVLNKLIKQTDIVMASGKFSLWSVAFFSFFYQKCTIAIIHGTEVNFSNTILKSLTNNSLRRFKTIIAVSKYTKSLIDNMSLKNVTVIPNGYDDKAWSGLVSKYDINSVLNLITVGNVTDRKGQMNVIRHLPNVISQYPNVHYHCVGIPTQKDEFFEIARALKVQEYVTFHGRLAHSELQNLLLNSTINVMLSSPTSTGDVEGFGIAIIEANSLGLPAIGSKDCGIEDAINPNKSGLLIPYNDSEAFITAIKTILEGYEDYQRNSIAWASKHRWNTIVHRYIEILELCD